MMKNYRCPACGRAMFRVFPVYTVKGKLMKNSVAYDCPSCPETRWARIDPATGKEVE